jgi:hypothetical protein
MSAKVISVKNTRCKFSLKPAFTLELLTDQGVMAKTINVGSRDYWYLVGRFSDIQSLKDQAIEVDLIPSIKKPNWFDVHIRKDNEN